LTELIKYEVGIFIEKAQAKGIKLSFSINEHTPATINSDPEKLKHILHSLLDNAIKFTAQGEVKVNVNTAQRASVSMLHISISDTGISIPKEQQDKIFEVCTQADGSTTRGFGGLGLGLSITRKLVEQMGGEISLQTTPDVGSTFSIYLPFQETTS
ncbi:MAG: ATP-binding protein, partial [Gammaproteobacteria bacterium]|nr:ATP-binding protein [Gammaproteobacteria bacterium]